MVKVRFYDEVEDSLLKFAVMIARHDGKWVFCKHRKLLFLARSNDNKPVFRYSNDASIKLDS